MTLLGSLLPASHVLLDVTADDTNGEPLDPNDQSDGTLIGVMNNAGTDALTWMLNGEPEANRIEDGDALRYYP